MATRDDADGIGTRLDRFQWDYEPKEGRRGVFLKPLSSVFGKFQWEGYEGRFPRPPGPKKQVVSAEDETTGDD